MAPNLQKIIHDKGTQPNEFRELLKRLYPFCIDAWSHPNFFLPHFLEWVYPKLYIPQFCEQLYEEVRALNKGLVIIIFITNGAPLDKFPTIVATVLHATGKISQLLKIKVYNGIQERKIGVMILPFQIYQIGLLDDIQYITSAGARGEELLENFDFKKYITDSYMDVFWKAWAFKNHNC